MKIPSVKVLKEGLERAGEISESATHRLANGGNGDDRILQALADQTFGRIGRILARMEQRGTGHHFE